MLSRIRLFAFAVAVCGSCQLVWAQTSAASGALPLPENLFPQLKPLLEAAVRESPGMISRNAVEAMAENDRVIARAQELPALGGYLNYFPWDRDERKSDPNSPYTSQKSAYHLDLTQPVFHWGALEARTKIAELQEKAARGDTAGVYQGLANQIRARFLGLVVKKADLARVRTGQALAEEQYKLAKERFDRGEITDADLANAELAREQARLTTDRWVDDWASSKRVLAKLCGTEALRDEQIPVGVPPVSAELGPLQSIYERFAAEKEPPSRSLASLRAQIEMEKLNYKIADARLRPKVNAVVGTSQDEQSYTANIGAKYGVTAYYAGVQVNWSIFDGFATKATKRNALVRRRELERTYEQATEDVREDVRAKFRQLQFSLRNLEITERYLRLAEDNLKRTRENLSRGLASESDLRSAEYSQAGTMIGVYQTRAEVLNRTAEFLGAVVSDPVLANLPASRP